jgi:hypothetical protein
LNSAQRLMTVFFASYLACVVLLIFVSILNVLGFTATIESKDLYYILFLIFIVGIVSAFSMGAVFANESIHVGAIALAIFITAIAYALIFTGVILADEPAAEEEITEKTVTEKTAAEKTVTVTEKTVAEAFIALFGILLMMVAIIVYFYALWTDP